MTPRSIPQIPLVILCLGLPAIDAAPIIWGPATTISADTDILTAGGFVYACNASNANQTANGVIFTGSWRLRQALLPP